MPPHRALALSVAAVVLTCSGAAGGAGVAAGSGGAAVAGDSEAASPARGLDAALAAGRAASGAGVVAGHSAPSGGRGLDRALAAEAARAAAARAAGAARAGGLPPGAPKYVLFVIVDDLGHADVGFHPDAGGPSREVSTPVMDALAAEGVVLNRHYVHMMCTPSRSSFMTGRLPVHVQLTLDNPEASNAGVPYNMTGLGLRMLEAGYRTSFTGKWDLGWATARHSPLGRGFEQSLVYAEHKNDYWNKTLQQSVCEAYNPIVDLWDNGAPATPGSDYEEFIFRDRVLSVIAAHDPAEPLFLTYTPHVAHCPLQVPPDWLARFGFVTDDEAECSVQTSYIFPGSTLGDFRCRAQYHAMVSLLDEVLGNITGALKARGMWEDTLMVLTSDNGGPSDPQESASSNHPLRGGKYSHWEGGIRATAFVSGGFVPPAVRGTTNGGIVHIADWYGTFCALAGVDPADAVAAAAGLPPVDSVNVWPLLSGANATSPRTEFPVAPGALVSGNYKLLLGNQIEATWAGAVYPNASSPGRPVDPGPTLACGQAGCLFDVVADPTEHVDVAGAHPDVVAALKARLKELEPGFYTNADNFTGATICPPDANVTPCACWAALNVWGRFLGPWSDYHYEGATAGALPSA